MATVDTSTLAVRVKVIGKRELDKLSRSFTRLGDVARGYGNRIESTLDATNTKWKKHFDFVDKMVKGMGMALTKFVGMSAKFATVQIAALGVSMMAVHAAFVLGNGAMKAFRGIAQLSAGAVAGLTIALSAAAAAMREQQAAMFAYRGVGKSAFGTGLNQVRVELRGLMMDADLAAVGAENLMAAFTTISQKGVYTQGTQRLLKGLMDFASAGQDIKTGSKAAAELVATLIDPKANFSKISEAAKALGPQMVQALEEAKKKGIDTADELKAAILDGSLAIMGGVQGQFAAFNSTLISRFKKAFAFMKEIFADFGQPFLEPLKFELAEVESIMRSTFMRITGDVSSFAQNNFIGNISVVVEKLANFMADLIHEYLPKVNGMFSRMGEWWSNFRHGWNTILDTLRPLIDAARVLERMLMEVLRPVGDALGEGFMHLRDLIVENDQEFQQFGRSIGRFITEFSEFAGNLREIFIDALPFLTKVVDGATALFDIFTSLLGTLKAFTGGLGDFGPFALIASLVGAGRGMKNTIGGVVPNTGTMNVNAGTVNVAGMTPGGGYMPSGMRSGAPIPAGAQSLSNYARSMSSGGAGTGISSAAAKRGGFMGGFSSWFAPGYTESIKKGPGVVPPGRIGEIRSAMRARRDTRFNTALYGNEALGKKGLVKSTGGAIGASLALGALSNFAGKEAQGALALGSTVGMFNPMAGLMVGLGGTALTSTTAGGGALSGAAAGAAAGSMLGPAGMAAGAVIGGLVGGISGWINGDKKKKKEAREAGKKAMSTLIDNSVEGFSESVRNLGAGALTTRRIGFQFDQLLKPILTASTQANELLSSGANDDALRSFMRTQREAGNQLFTGMSDADFEKALKKPKEFFQTIPQQAFDFEQAQVAIEDKYSARLTEFTRITGKSEEEIIRLADAVGVNLFDATMETSEMVKKLASGMINDFRGLQAASADRLGKISGIFSRPAEMTEASTAIQDVVRNLFDQITAGGLTKENAGLQMDQILQSLVQFYGGDTGKAEDEFFRLFGRGGAAYAQGAGPLAGQEAAIMGLIGPQIAQAQNLSLGGRASDFQEFINSQLLGAGLQLGQGQADKIGGAIRSGEFTLQEQTGIINYLATADLTQKETQAVLDKMLTDRAGIGVSIDAFKDSAETAALNLKDASEGFKAAVDGLIGALEAADLIGGDTKTRRAIGDTSSALGKTLSSHSALSSSIPGKRIITSSYRNFALGSLNSDHLSGNALDLVGDNLVSYRDAVNRSGGFAEFHGGLGGNRHLHVVPNTRGIGDTATQVAPMPSSASSSDSVVVNNTFNISGVDAGKEELVNTIIARINSSVRDARERR